VQALAFKNLEAFDRLVNNWRGSPRVCYHSVDWGEPFPVRIDANIGWNKFCERICWLPHKITVFSSLPRSPVTTFVELNLSTCVSPSSSRFCLIRSRLCSDPHRRDIPTLLCNYCWLWSWFFFASILIVDAEVSWIFPMFSSIWKLGQKALGYVWPCLAHKIRL